VTKPKILVIDDEKGVRDLLRAALERWGYAVLTASQGHAALALMRESAVDMVISDLRMPGLSGEELVGKLKAEWPEVPVVVISAYGGPRHIVEVIKKGAEDYLAKPFSDEDLEVVVFKALEKHRLLLENLRLRQELEKGSSSTLVGMSPGIRKLRQAATRVAASSEPVLITGESGTGKELVAALVHASSERSKGPFVAVNAGAIPATLFEAELFGAKKGSYTGADEDRKGLFQQADGGTLFLDEIGELPLEMQAKLLRVIETGILRALGDSRSRRVDVRIVAATNQDLKRMVEDQRFRRDLYFRLAVLPLHVPPLRERLEDIPLLAEHFLRAKCKGGDRRFSPALLKALLAHAWPGNVRELKNAIERALVLCQSKVIEPGDLLLERHGSPAKVGGPLEAAKRLNAEAFERQYLLEALEDQGWNISKAAKLAGKERSNFHALMRKHRIKRPR
jgi:DNA-binding NtrC family response regulator